VSSEFKESLDPDGSDGLDGYDGPDEYQDQDLDQYL
jgi:hypothetical protein